MRRREAVVGKLIFINSDRLGRGDDELGARLTGMFLYSLANGDSRPETIVLMNGGVRLAVEGSEAIEHLRKLSDAGTKIYACGTCLDYFGLKDKLAVGEVGNMNATAELFMNNDVVTV
ncbi:MAG: sulfurtransferase-like selenium metabolism protein YedF [Actinobacteria bacterium]|nr:MAG: sulfurtransferase-like selenium metabolism protein YedF [Actinomycetota bacterium]